MFRIGTLVVLASMLTAAGVPNRYTRSEVRHQGRPRRHSRTRYEAPPIRFGMPAPTEGLKPSTASAGLGTTGISEPATVDMARKRPWNYCYTCERTPSGRIRRNTAAHRAFRQQNPCPATGSTTGACPGYVVDHILPLKRGGQDVPGNMQWQSIGEGKAKDRWE